jgi:hypothetical protein
MGVRQKSLFSYLYDFFRTPESSDSIHKLKKLYPERARSTPKLKNLYPERTRSTPKVNTLYPDTRVSTPKINTLYLDTRVSTPKVKNLCPESTDSIPSIWCSERLWDFCRTPKQILFRGLIFYEQDAPLALSWQALSHLLFFLYLCKRCNPANTIY